MFHPQLFQLKERPGQVDAREEKAGLGRGFPFCCLRVVKEAT